MTSATNMCMDPHNFDMIKTLPAGALSTLLQLIAECLNMLMIANSMPAAASMIQLTDQ